MLLRIDPTLLAAEVREEPPEPAPLGAPLFPHVYGHIEVGAVTGLWSLQPEPDGSFQLPAIDSLKVVTVSRVPDAALRGQLVVVRPGVADDADLLVAWHADPEVAPYWDNKVFTREEMLVRLARPDVDPYIVEESGEPIGYLQAWFDNSIGDAGLDMFLIPRARDGGLGPDAARTLARWLLTSGVRYRLTVDPYLSNKRAIRAWTKAGFRPVAQREPDHEHTEAWLLMESDWSALYQPPVHTPAVE